MALFNPTLYQISQGRVPQPQPVYRQPIPNYTGSTLISNLNQKLQPQNVTTPVSQPPSDGGGGGSSRLDELRKIEQAGNLNPAQRSELDELLKGQRESAESQSERMLRAALGVFEAKKQASLNRIPGIQQALELRKRGLDEGLTSFNETADRTMGGLLGQLGEQRGAVEEEYTQAGRKVRSTAQGLARQLRNMFASKGSLDSTQYRDMNIDQSTDIARSIGDITREKAGKMTSIGREEGETQKYFAEQKTQQARQIELQKDQATAETNDLVQRVLDDVNLTDAQKIEAVESANARLSDRLGQLDAQEYQLKQQQIQDDRDFQVKMAEVANKGLSSSYKNAISNRDALGQAESVLAAAVKNMENLTGTQPSSADTFSLISRLPLSDEEKQGLMYRYFPQGGNAFGGGQTFNSGDFGW